MTSTTSSASRIIGERRLGGRGYFHQVARSRKVAPGVAGPSAVMVATEEHVSKASH